MPDDALVVLDGSTFFVSAASGDVAGTEAEGFFHADMRHLSAWHLLVEGAPMRVLTSRSLRYYSASIFGTLASARVGENPTVSIQRDRIVADGVHEDIILENNSETERAISLELRFGADFADIFEIKDGTPKKGRTWAESRPGEVTLWYERDGFRRGTRISFSEPCEVREDSARFDVALGPRATWKTHVDVSCLVGGEERRPRHDCESPGDLQPQMPLSLEQWLEEAPRLETDFDPLIHTYRRSLLDLAALRFRPLEQLEWSLPAAGLPWFMALFGRDSLITAYEALPFQPRLAATTLEALAEYQAKEDDPFRDAEPGKILHELRVGELAMLGEVPHTPYYGTHDATPLFLILLDEYERWTGDAETVGRLEPAARAALAWIEGSGDPDGDGYLEYRTRSPKGLVNQCWKDSWNSVRFADGRLAHPPIATCEIQGYAYDARRRTARLAREIWGDHALADRLGRSGQSRRDGTFGSGMAHRRHPAGEPEQAIGDRLGEVMQPRVISVEFGPSRSKRFAKAVALARENASEFADLGQGRYRARFLLGDDPALYKVLGALVERVRGWRATEVSIEDEPASAYHVKEMAWCASAQLKNWGICRFRFVYGIMPRCSLCPLFDVERAIRDSMGEFQPTGGVVIELGPAIRAVLRGDPVPPEEEEEELDAEVPDFAPEDWGGPPAEESTGGTPSV